MSFPKIYADFNNVDGNGRLRLNTNGSREDIEKQQIKLADDLEILVYDGELLADGRAIYSPNEKIWVAEIEWSKIKREPQK